MKHRAKKPLVAHNSSTSLLYRYGSKVTASIHQFGRIMAIQWYKRQSEAVWLVILLDHTIAMRVFNSKNSV